MPTDRVLDQISAWREDLINLNRNNRLLYFRKTKSSTLELREPTASDLLGRLSTTNKGVMFWEPPDDRQADIETVGRTEGGELSLAFLDDTTPVARVESEPSVREPRRKRSLASANGEIVCDVAGREPLLRTLRWLERRATQEFMDKGLWVLYLAVGILDWIEPPRETGESESVSSPIILIPVALRRDSSHSPYQLFRADEDATVNPALAFKLQHDFGITLPTFEDDDEEDVDALLDSVRDIVASHEDWSVRDTAVLSVFSFHKEAMYRDLRNNEAAVAAHPLVRCLALGHRTDQGFAFEPAPEHDLDEQHPPESMVSILDCDASQRQCLVAAAVGQSFVMEGPPGTGKSQTIANMIADALGHDKTVLFVSEKAAALEVVQNRLDQAGLSEFVLELHSHKATRKQVAQALGRSLTTRLASRGQFSDVDLQRLIGHRRELTAYALAMNERRAPLGKSVHEVLGELSGFQHLPQAPLSNSIDTTLTAAQLARIYDAAEALSHSWGPVERGDDFLWRGLVDGNLTRARRASLLATLERALGVVEELEIGTTALAQAADLAWHDNFSDAVRFDGLLTLLAQPHNVPTTWLSIQSLDPVTARLETLAATSESINRFVSEMSSTVGPSWRELPQEDLGPLGTSRASLESSQLGFLVADLTAPQAAVAVSGRLRDIVALAQDGLVGATALASALEAPTPRTAPELRRLLDLAACVSSPHKPPPHWFAAARLPEIREAANALEPCVDTVKISVASVETLFSPAMLELDVEGLQLRFDQIHQGFGKLRPAYWRDKRTVRQHAKSGRVRRAEIAGLQKAVDCKRHQRELTALESRYAATLGPSHYSSLNSDFSSIRSALDVADAILRLAAGQVSQEALSQRFSTHAERAADVTNALSGMQHWAQQFAAASARLGPVFEKRATERPLSELVVIATAAAADTECIGTVLSHISRISNQGDVSLDRAIGCLATRRTIEKLESDLSKDGDHDRELLGPAYAGHTSAFSELANDVTWAEKLRSILGRPIPFEVASRVLRLDVGRYRSLAHLLTEWSQLEVTLLSQFDDEHAPTLSLELRKSFVEAKSLLSAFAQSIDDVSEWGAYATALSTLSGLGLESAAKWSVHKRLAAADANAVLRRSALESWIDSVRQCDVRLQAFHSKDRDRLAEAFRDLDRRFIQVATAKVIDACNARRPTINAGAAGLIATEANKQKRHMPIRRLIDQAAPVVQALKPCMMMSPLSVSQFLPPTMRFDLVVFDEASQVKPADAINCIYRGKQLVIAGDQKQLPPTPFFDKLDSDSGDEWDEEQIDEFESVLDVAKGSGALQAMALRWHYRSQHEDLITYSNYSFYDGRLITFPSANTHGPDVGVELFLVPGVYRRGGARDNPIEARKVIERILFHIRTHPHLSIGVVAFSEAQANTIENEILRCCDECPELRIMIDGDRLHGGFVKNLESVQGDERDIIIFSIGYGRDEAGRFTLNFGPLNKSGGHRRLNVAITRARRRIEVVSSIASSDFVGDLRSDGVRHLRRYLDFAARSDNRLAALGVEVSPEGRDSESPFEEEVARVVRSWGYDVVPQVGCADYRIDMAVRHPAQPGRYALGIECDGAMYHSSRVARDRDRLRQEVLVRLGWTNLHRIWGLSWYWNRGQEEMRLRTAIERAVAGHPDVVPARPADPPDPEELTFVLNETPEWVVPYRVVTPGPPFTAAAMHEGAAQGDIQRMILEVVQGEGPVSAEVVLRRVRTQWGTKKAGSRVRGAFDTALRTLRRRGEIVYESDGFFALPNGGSATVRAGVRTDPETIRTIHEIPSSELKQAIVRFVEHVHSITEDELTARVSSVFGWTRRGTDIASEFRKVVRKLVIGGVLTRKEDNLTVSNDPQGD